jgi:hypothetical protein
MLHKLLLRKLNKIVIGIFGGVFFMISCLPITSYALNVTYPDPTPNGTTPNPAINQSTGVEIDEDTMVALDKFNRTYNGKNFNALCYFLNYQDLRIDPGIGANPYALYQHYVDHGFAEKRVADQVINPTARTSRSKFEYVVPSYQKTKKQKDGMTVIPDEIHSNGGMNRRQENEARSVAYQLAQHIYDQVNVLGNGTQIQMVAYATGIVRAYCNCGRELTEEEVKSTNNKLYRTSYGVFIAHEYTSAGATRALGLILDYLDQLWDADYQLGLKEYAPLKWVHVNANKWDDQWCQIVCDNHEAYADPIQSWAGYGKHPNWGGRKQDYQTYYGFAFESDIINTRPRYVDGEYQITGSNPTYNANPMGNKGQSDSYYETDRNPQNP